ncbi:MAG: hypothetical protein ACMG6S_19975 [Byssovorax sp.]
MRLLGTKTTLAAFRWDLIYLSAQLVSDERPGVSDLAPPVQALLAQTDAEHAAYQQTEDAVIVAGALVDKKDSRRDKILVAAGGVTRATEAEVYKTLFPRLNPSLTARLGIDAESTEVDRILGELAKLPADSALRISYEKPLTEAEALLKVASKQSDQAATSFALQRSQLERFKLTLDQQRLVTHGSLLVLLKSKTEADAFFRATSTPPGEPAVKDTQASATPQAPSASPANIG